jgi:hypothetical protein
MDEMNRYLHNILFHSQSICDRNTSIFAKGLWEWGSEPIKYSRWYSRSREGRELVEDNDRADRPKWTRTEVNIASVADMFKNDRQISTRMTAETLKIPKTLVIQILKEGFGIMEDLL